MPDIPRMLVLLPGGLGSALMAMPLVRQLGRGLPGSRIMVMARTRAMAEVFERLPEVHEARRIGPGLGEMVWALAMLPRPDVCVVPFPSNQRLHMLLALASGAQRRVMHGYPVGRIGSLGFVPADRIPAVPGLHDVVQNLNLLRSFGIEPDLSEGPRFPVLAEDRVRADELLAGVGIPADVQPVVVHPGSAATVPAEAGQWPAECYGMLVEAGVRRWGDRIVLLEGPEEIGEGDEVIRHCTIGRRPVLKLRGSIAEAAGVLERASVYIGPDCGLAHLAAAVGTPAVTLFAPTDPERVAPWGCRELVVQPRGRSCTPCVRYPFASRCVRNRCRVPRCIDDVHIDDVVAAIEKAIGRVAGQRESVVQA